MPLMTFELSFKSCIEAKPKTGLMPSASDVEIAGIDGDQVVHTQFREKDGTVVNPGTKGEGGQISITISNVRRLPTKSPNSIEHYYEAKFTARAAGKDEPLWSQTAYVKRIAGTDGASDEVMFTPNNTVKALLAAAPP